MAKTRAFVSFDFDNDKKLRDFIIGQAKNSDSPFEVADHSLKEAAPQKGWEAKAHRAIAQSEIFIIMLGPKTKRAPGVLKEVKMAKALKKRMVQIIGYQNGSRDLAIPEAGRTYRWKWDSLKKILK